MKSWCLESPFAYFGGRSERGVLVTGNTQSNIFIFVSCSSCRPLLAKGTGQSSSHLGYALATMNLGWSVTKTGRRSRGGTAAWMGGGRWLYNDGDMGGGAEAGRLAGGWAGRCHCVKATGKLFRKKLPIPGAARPPVSPIAEDARDWRYSAKTLALTPQLTSLMTFQPA